MSGISAQASPPISRRTFAKGAAWAAPVVAIAIAAPAAAASGSQVSVTLSRHGNRMRVTVTLVSGTIAANSLSLNFTVASMTGQISANAGKWPTQGGSSSGLSPTSAAWTASPVFNVTTAMSTIGNSVYWESANSGTYKLNAPWTTTGTISTLPATVTISTGTPFSFSSGA